MKLKSPQLWIAALSAAAVSLIAVVDLGRTSPGPLTNVHESESDLRGSGNCAECHGGWFSDMTDACTECHEDIAKEIDDHQGLHGVVAQETVEKCALCHSEHHGAGFAIVNRQSFAMAGVADPAKFDHNKIGFAMDGAHLELACAECHKNANAAVLSKGEKRYLGLDQNCVTCHEDVHKGQFALACESCHGQAKWDELRSIGHEKHLPLIGGHAGIDCRECHAQSDLHSLEALGGHGSKPRARDCRDCHESPHSQPFVDGAAALANMAPSVSCVVCHAPEHDSFRDPRLELTPAQHAESGFALTLPHDQAACADCHSVEGKDFAARYPGRDADKCSTCHEDVHEGQFATGPFSTGDCLACHEREHWEPNTFDIEKHARASLDLTGKHAEIECNDCHELGDEGSARVFRGTPSNCDECHADAHDGFFAKAAARAAPVAHGECALCHDTMRFDDIAADAFDHARWTEFPILGAHAQNDCEACHVPAKEPDDVGRKFGRVADHFGEYTGCETCHKYPHEGEFDYEDQPETLDGREGCARCHVESSFRTFPHGFEHGLWTGFSLVGAHLDAGCAACHTPLRKPDAVGRTWARAKGADCFDCHGDPHVKQFEVAGRTNCSRCHTSTIKSYLKFDHDRDSRFALEGAHEKLECAACHQPALVRGVETTLYKPMGVECFDCHGVHEEVLLRRKPRKK